MGCTDSSVTWEVIAGAFYPTFVRELTAVFRNEWLCLL